MHKNKGFSLVYMMLFINIISILGLGIANIVFSTKKSTDFYKGSIYAFYLAEAAIEYGKFKLQENPSWYTDIIHSKDITKWLKKEAKGYQKTLSENYTFKTVKEYKQPALYGVGFYDKSCVIIKLEKGVLEELY